MKCKTVKYQDATPVTPSSSSKYSPYSFKMPFGNSSGYQGHYPYLPYHSRQPIPFYPSTYFQNSRFRSSNQREREEKKSDSWACDYCHVATFGSYDEACEHEKSCEFNQNNVTPMETCIPTELPKPSSRILLCMPSDKQSLSDRQCYVRSHFVEIFEATVVDVSSRHSKGAQKLSVGQIGIRCMHCVHLSPKVRAERATCYPSSISRIYQTVADMQRFHFEACMAISKEMKDTYKSLKTTRCRGNGSPQAYWINSAKELGLVDTDSGIRLSKKTDREAFKEQQLTPANSKSNTRETSPITTTPESENSVTTSSTVQENCVSDDDIRDEEANMLLALRHGVVSQSKSDDSQ